MARRRKEATLLRKTAVALDGAPGVAPGTHLLVAVSGGPDSTALLAALAELAPARALRLTAAYVDHGLRGAEGRGEAALVAALATACGAGFVTQTVTVGAGANVEARARRARYRALGELADAAGASRIVTGHTRDDQVETVLFRLLRGAGRRGLGAMRPARGRLLRPFLAVTRADVRRYLSERGLTFAVDRTNADLRLVRNRLRRLLVPFLEAEFNPNLGPALAAFADRLRDEDDFLAALAAARAPALHDGDALRASVAFEPPALARRIVRAWLVRSGQASAAHVERVLALARGGRGAVALPGPARVVREHDRLVRRAGREAARAAFVLAIAPGQSVADPSGAWRVSLLAPRARSGPEERCPPSVETAWFDAEALPEGLAVRPPGRGDRIRLLGGGTRKLQDVLVDAKVPREERAGVPVLAVGAEVLWVGGLARGIGAAVTASTRWIVEAVLTRVR